MENLFRKYKWVIRLTIIALACLLVALAVNAFIASLLAPYTVPELPRMAAAEQDEGERARAAARKTPRDRSGLIAGRCFFGCLEDAAPAEGECPEECPEGQTCVAGECVPTQPEAVSEDQVVDSELNIKLMGTMVSNRPRWSTALILDPSDDQTYVVRPGESILEQATLVEVKRDRIILDRAGRREFVKLQNTITGDPSAGGPTVAGQATGPAPGAEPAGGGDGASPGNDSGAQARPASEKGSGLREVGEGRYQVDREAMNAKLDNKAELARGASVIPNYKRGKKHGLKLMNVTDQSMYSTLGLQSGDVLTSVNGETIRSQAHALELMDKFREADRVTIEYERRGKSEELQYDIK